MRITVKSAGRLAKFLPASAEGNQADLEVPEGATPAVVMTQLGMAPDQSCLVIVNGENIPKSARPTHPLAEADTISIMPPLKGG